MDITRMNINMININNKAIPGSIDFICLSISTVIHNDSGKTIITRINIDRRINPTFF